MLLSPKSIQRLVSIMTGSIGMTFPASKKNVDDIFKEIGFEKLVTGYDECFKKHREVLDHINYTDDKFRLENYVRIKLEGINCLKQLKIFIEKYVEYITPIYKDYKVKKGQNDRLLEICSYINQEFENDNYKIVEIEEDDVFKLYSLDDSIISYECYFQEAAMAQAVLINDHYQKCINKIKNKDYSGAVTNSQSLLEQILVTIRNDINKTPDKGHNGELSTLLKKVLELLDITNGLKGSPLKGYKNIEDGFKNLTDGLKLFRFGWSDAHSRLSEPSRKDALLAVNTSKTLSNFIVEYYFENYLKRQ